MKTLAHTDTEFTHCHERQKGICTREYTHTHTHTPSRSSDCGRGRSASSVRPAATAFVVVVVVCVSRQAKKKRRLLGQLLLSSRWQRNGTGVFSSQFKKNTYIKRNKN